MKIYLLLFVFLTSIEATSQNYVAPEPTKPQIEEAKKLTLELDNVLSLTEKQILRVEKVAGEFIARRDELLSDQELTIPIKNELLEALYVEEGNEMADILVRTQIERYKKVRGDLQPLIVLTD